MHFKWKSKFGHYDPKWPQVNIWPHNIGRGSQADEHVWGPIVYAMYSWTSYSILVQMTFWPQWPQMTPD